MTGSIVESRYNYGGEANTVIPTAPANTSGVVSDGNKYRNYMVIAILVALAELALIGILLVMAFSHEDKVCTYDDVARVAEKEDSPSENWKIYESYGFHDPEDALAVYAEVMTNGDLKDDGFLELVRWSEGYTELFGGNSLNKNAKPSKYEWLMADGGGSEMFWRLLVETNEGCARFDLGNDFTVLEKYSLTEGNCDEFTY